MSSKRDILVLDSTNDIYSIIKKIIEKCDESFYVCDVSKLIFNINNWKKLMPRIEIFFATKCNNSWIVLETFAALGLGFDCASKEEIRKVLSLGVSPDKIVFSNTTKMVSHIKYANEVGVKVMTFDNEAELHKIKSHHPNSELLIRIKFDDLSARYILGKKFGVNADIRAYNLLKIAKSLNLNIIGVHFHVGSRSQNPSIYYNAIATAHKVFEMGTELGYQFKLLDIGGGFPGGRFSSFDKTTGYINKAIEEYFPDESVKITAEPGFYCCNTPFKLVTQIHSKNIVTDSNNQKIRMYYVDVSIFNSLSRIIFGEKYVSKGVHTNDHLSKEIFPSIIWGATSENTDRISEPYDYLTELEIGDWIIVNETGGYSLSINCDYNGVTLPDLYVIINTKDWLMLTETVPKPFAKIKFTTSLETFLFIGNKPNSSRKKYF